MAVYVSMQWCKDNPYQEIIYADIAASAGSTANHFAVILDDDRVQYAEIKHDINGNPTAKTRNMNKLSKLATKGEIPCLYKRGFYLHCVCT